MRLSMSGVQVVTMLYKPDEGLSAILCDKHGSRVNPSAAGDDKLTQNTRERRVWRAAVGFWEMEESSEMRGRES